MKNFAYLAVALASAIGFVSDSRAARISEPGTTFYGRIFTRVGDREFPITEGDLKWTVTVAALDNRQQQFTTQLEPLGGGRFSYRLSVSHQALAYDLAVTGRNLPITAAGVQIRHAQVLVNGKPATLIAPAIDSFSAQQSQRAATYRVDLEVKDLGLDSDGDGYPDWWEDRYGTDKWNPADGQLSTPSDTNNTSGGAVQNVSSFAQWREQHFPGATGDLNLFGQQDPDEDGVPNLLEYAFRLNPSVQNVASSEPSLPKAELRDGAFALRFTRNLTATDLDYQVELSGDLISWTAAQPAELEPVSIPATDTAAGVTCIRESSAAPDDGHRYMRVRVSLK